MRVEGTSASTDVNDLIASAISSLLTDCTTARAAHTKETATQNARPRAAITTEMRSSN